MKRMRMGWVWGLVLILLGIMFLAKSMGATGVHDLIVSWWPVILIILGLNELVSRNYFNAAFWLIIGVIIGLFTTGIIKFHGNIWQIIWPAILILIGLRFIFRPSYKMHVTEEREAYFESSAVFGGSHKKISTKGFKGTAVKAFFGGVKLDLREAQIDKDGAVIDISAVFGGVEILVPKKTRVKTDIVAIFGGHDDKRAAGDINEKLPAITIRGEAIFGGVEIKD